MSHTYPPIRAYSSEMLEVDDGQQVYIEQTGNPDGIPVLYLHGGPGAGLDPAYRSLFNPQIFRIIGFDQRGCGRSLPFGSLKDNTTQHLLKDICTIRKHLKIDKWMLCGGSWGATLALLAAIDQPKTVKAIVLRGTFLGRQEDIDWFIKPDGGAAQIFPEHYQDFVDHANHHSSNSFLLESYYEDLQHGDEITRMAAAKAWCMWEERISQLNTSVVEHDLTQNLHRAHSLALFECHYLVNRFFIEDNFILNNVNKIRNIPATIIHGRYDMVCKMEAAHTLRNAWRNSQLIIVPESGHSISEPLVAEAVCHSTEAMAKFLQESEK